MVNVFRMDNSLEEYLNPTLLCDFNRAPEIKDTTLRLTAGLTDTRQKIDCLFGFIKELPYILHSLNGQLDRIRTFGNHHF